MDIKTTIRNLLNFFHLDLTKNLLYDRLTKKIMKQILKSDSNCIDVGCHKGEILDIILKYAPNGKHFAFEPIPSFFHHLDEEYNNKAQIFPYALAQENGNSTFQFVKNAPAYSGIKKRKYDIENPDIEEIKVELKRLDDLIPPNLKIDFIKIDVEGAEFGVLKGAKGLLSRDKPIIVFECGLGASDYYDTKPNEIFSYLSDEIGYKISLLKSFVENKQELTIQEFEDIFNKNSDYYFIAHT